MLVVETVTPGEGRSDGREEETDDDALGRSPTETTRACDPLETAADGGEPVDEGETASPDRNVYWNLVFVESLDVETLVRGNLVFVESLDVETLKIT